VKTYTDSQGVPYITVAVRIRGQRQIDTWDAMTFLSHRRSHELAADVVLDSIRDSREDPEVKELTRNIRRSRSGLKVAGDG
jgi:hypothetical protein